MVKLLIGSNYKKIQVLIWKFIKGSNGCKIKTFGRPFNHKKHMQDECMGVLKILISFHAPLKTRFMQ